MNPWDLPTTGNLAYDDYRRALQEWSKAHPYTGDEQYDSRGVQDLVGGSIDSVSNLNPGRDAWGQQQNEAFYKQLTPDQWAEWQRLAEERDAKLNRNGKLAAAATFAAIGGLGALGNPGAFTSAFGGAAPVAGTTEVASSAGLSSFIPGVDSAALGSSGLAQVPAWALPGGASATELAGMGLGGTAASGASSAWNSIPEFLKSLGTSAAKNLGGNFLSQIISAGTNAYMGNKQAGQYQDVINQINGLFAPDSPYAKQMEQALARKDAAAGRNSQYGTRSVELAAALTKDKANALTSAGYGNLLMNRGINQNVPWNGFLAALGSGPGQDLITKAGGNVGSWLGGLFGNSGDKITPTTPNSGNNWWDNWGGYIGGGP